MISGFNQSPGAASPSAAISGICVMGCAAVGFLHGGMLATMSAKSPRRRQAAPHSQAKYPELKGKQYGNATNPHYPGYEATIRRTPQPNMSGSQSISARRSASARLPPTYKA